MWVLWETGTINNCCLHIGTYEDALPCCHHEDNTEKAKKATFASFRETFTRLACKSLSEGASFALASALQRVFYDTQTQLILNIDLKPHSVPQRTLVVWGMNDRSHSRTDKKSILHYLREGNYLYEEFEGCGHFPELQQPQRFTQLLLRFLHE